MLKYLLFAALFLTAVFKNTTLAQDSTQYVVYDVVYLKDGRILKGNILAYDANLGGLSFRDTEGRVYNFSREQYNYFVEKKQFPIKSKDKVIRARNEEKTEVTLGLNLHYTYMYEELTDKSYYTSNMYGVAEMPLSLSAGIGRYFTRKHYFGVVGDFGVISSPKFFNAGLKYKYEYDAAKSNLGLYIPIELRYQNMQLSNNYEYYDTLWYDGGGYYYGNMYHNAQSSFSAANFSIGHGFAFIMKNGGSFNIELQYLKYFILSHKYVKLNADLPRPESTFALQGFRIGMSLSF